MTPPTTTPWPLWQRAVFRFLFVYFLLQAAPWNWLGRIPGLGVLNAWYSRAVNWAVTNANAHLFRTWPTLVAPNGSGDTSWGWTQMWLYLLVATVAAVVWSVVDRRQSYPKLGYVFRNVVRYYVAAAALSYGIIKLFLLQMPFPSLSQLATPLGDLLPMRLSWLFIGYSDRYQFFSGAMETVAGLLLLNRRTVTLGLIAAAGAFINVVMINLSYDVPVKIFSSHLFAASMILLAMDAPRLWNFFVLNRAVEGTRTYEPPFVLPWQRIMRVALKATLVVLMLVLPFYRGWQAYQRSKQPIVAVPFGTGIYDVALYVVNGDTIPDVRGDTLRWSNMIFDNASSGSVGTTDTLFWQRYRRGYFRYRADTAARTLHVWRSSVRLDSVFAFSAQYERPDSVTIRLRAKVRDDSVFVELARSNRRFQLAERQFHWLSEYNR